MDEFDRFVHSIFPVDSAGIGPHWSYVLDDRGCLISLVFYVQPGDAKDAGKKHLTKIWDNRAKWCELAREVILKHYPQYKPEDLDFSALYILWGGEFSIGLRVEDDPDNLTLFVDFNRRFVPKDEVLEETY